MMETVYSPKDIEDKHYQKWEQSGAFKPAKAGDPFTIVMPPPNVTGVLHMGHALDHTLQDIVIRYKRMQGFRTLWVPGTDHAGIATQNVVEKALKKEGKNRFDLGREAFVQKVWDWKHQYGSHIEQQIRKLGDSVDWEHNRFTMDEGCHDAVLTHFIKLYDAGYLYRGYYIINWCPRCETALSDVEVEHEPAAGHLWEIRYPFTHDPKNGIVVATTRPETMFGDVAVAVHPDDSRYKSVIGKTVTLPFVNREIPIIADEYVDPAFGSGAVKITPAHDLNDFEMGKRHQLDTILVMTEKAIMNDQVPPQYQGLSREKCRAALVPDLESAGFLVGIKDHELSKGTCYRCQTIVEPYLSKQWFVKMKEITRPAIDAVRNGDIEFIPKRWEKLYFDWMESIRDWCVSRQIWWGHRIPVWYRKDDPDQTPILARNETEAIAKAGTTEIYQDNDVLDTWFSSALWPFETLGWPEKTDDLNVFYPNSLLVTGYDIITFWVSRMITMGLYQMKTIPFKTVYVHGLVRDASGRKMSKSVGNAVDPLALIDQFGADALRFSLASMATLGGQDIKFSIEKVESCRNFANKLWNVSRFILMSVEEAGQSIQFDSDPAELDVAVNQGPNGWILSVYQTTLGEVNRAYEHYNFAQAAELLWEFTWNKFCDWFIEMSKDDKVAALPVLTTILAGILKLLHPFMPFITEEIWERFRESGLITLKDTESNLIGAPWPKGNSAWKNEKLESDFALGLEIIREIRNARKQLNVPPKNRSNLIVQTDSNPDKLAVEMLENIIKKLGRVDAVSFISTAAEKPDKSAALVVGTMSLFLPLSGLIDVADEIARLAKQVAKIDQELGAIMAKLGNSNFRDKAPAEVVAKIQAQADDLTQQKALLDQQISLLR